MQHVRVKPLKVETGDCNSSNPKPSADYSSTSESPQFPETGGTFEDVVSNQLNAKTHHQCNSSSKNNDRRMSNHGALLSNLRIDIPPLQIYLPKTNG